MQPGSLPSALVHLPSILGLFYHNSCYSS